MFFAQHLLLSMLDFRALDTKRFGRVNPPFLKSVSISLDVIHVLEIDSGRPRSSNNRSSSFAETVFLGRGLVGLTTNSGMVSIITRPASVTKSKIMYCESQPDEFQRVTAPSRTTAGTASDKCTVHDKLGFRLP